MTIMQDIFNYDESILNPALKLLIFLIFLVATILYFVTSRRHGGRIRTVVIFTLLFLAFMSLASLFRYFGHGTEFGFTKELSLKWLQSIGYIISGIFFVLAGIFTTKVLERESK